MVAATDPHVACIACMGHLHAYQATLADPPDCEACAHFSPRILAARHTAALNAAGLANNPGNPFPAAATNYGPGGPGLPGPLLPPVRPPPPTFSSPLSTSTPLVSQLPLRAPFTAGFTSGDLTATPWFRPPALPQASGDLALHAPTREHGELGEYPQPPILERQADPDPSDESEDLDDEEEEGEEVIAPLPQDTVMAEAAAPEPAVAQSEPQPGASGFLSLQRDDAKAPDDADTIPVSTLFERAFARCGLELPLEDQTAPAPLADFQGIRPPKQRPVRVKKLPTAKGFKDALHATWATHLDPHRLPFSTDAAEAADLGFGSMPPIDAMMALNIADRRKGAVSTEPKPSFTDPREKALSAAQEKAYRSAVFTARTLNASTILQASLSVLLEKHAGHLGEDAIEIDILMQLVLILNRHATQWTGRTMESIAAVERSRWLDLVTLDTDAPREAKKHLLGLPLTPSNLFHGAAEFMKDFTETRKAHREAAVGVLAPAAPPPAPKPRSDKSGERGRSSSRQPRATRPPAAAAAAAPKPAGQPVYGPREEGGGRPPAQRTRYPPKPRRDEGKQPRRGRGK